VKLKDFYLLYNYELSLLTQILSLINQVIASMTSSEFNYRFTVNPSAFLLSHESLPLQLLEIVNRGVPRTDGQVRLRCTAHQLLTLGDLANNRMHFAVPSIAIEGNQFVIHFGELFHTYHFNCEELMFYHLVVRMFLLICTAALNHDGNDGNGPRTHTCISHKVYSLFGPDGSIGNPNYDGDTSDEDNDAPAASSSRAVVSFAATSSSYPVASIALSTAATASVTSAPVVSLAYNVPSALQQLPSVSSYSFLPAQIWDVPWITCTGHYHGLFSPELLSECVYSIATDNVTLEKLEIRGKDVAELVTSLKELLAQAAAGGDFTKILSPERLFLM
jgi:hypothetical protein